MDRIIAGRFQSRADADIVAASIAKYIDYADICVFPRNPPPAHAPLAAERRPDGFMLSVRIVGPVDERRVIATLHNQGAVDIEHAQGEWLDGDWVDFDPVAAPLLVKGLVN